MSSSWEIRVSGSRDEYLPATTGSSGSIPAGQDVSVRSHPMQMAGHVECKQVVKWDANAWSSQVQFPISFVNGPDRLKRVASSHLRRPLLIGSVYRSLSDCHERTPPSSFVAHSPYWLCAQENTPSSAVRFSSQPQPCIYTFDTGSSSDAGLSLPLGLPREQITPSGAASYWHHPFTTLIAWKNLVNTLKPSIHETCGHNTS